CQALEALAGGDVPARARWLRVVLLELERLYNHVADVGMIVNDTGFAFGHAHCFRLREELLRLNERVAGHRLLRGAVVPGGVTGPVERASLAPVATTVETLVTEFLETARLCLDKTMVLERLQGTGRLFTHTAREMQVVGLVGRASGIDADLRRDAPFAAYGELGVRAAVYETGDVLARTMVRVDEIRESARLIRAAVAGTPGVAVRVAAARDPDPQPLEPVLSPSLPRLGRAHVLEHAEPAVGTEDAADFGEAAPGVRDAAEDEPAHHRVECPVVERERFRAPLDQRDVRRAPPRALEPGPHGIETDDPDALAIEGQVPPGSTPHVEREPARALDEPPPPPVEPQPLVQRAQ